MYVRIPERTARTPPRIKAYRAVKCEVRAARGAAPG